MILTTEQIQVIRRDVEAYLANNRKLKPTSLDAETMLQLLDTVDAQEDVITKLGRTVQNLKELTFTLIALSEPSLPASPPQAQVPEPYVDQEHNVVVDPALAPTMEEMPVSDFVTGETISRADHKKKYLQDLPTDETF